MQKIDTYIKIISLIYNESQLEKKSDNKDFISNVISVIKPHKKGLMGGITSIEDRLINIIHELLAMDYPINKDVLLDTISIGLKDDDIIKNTAITSIFKELDEKSRIKYVRDIKRMLGRRYNEYKFKNDINRISIKMNTTDTNPISNIALELEAVVNDSKLNKNNSGLPASFTKAVSIEDIDTVSNVIAEDITDDGGMRLKTGWRSLNRMLCGGFIRGETTMILFKRNDYKSSLVRTLLAQVAIVNTPKMLDVNKKPLLAIITLEDSILEILTFIYKYLYSDMYGKLPQGKSRDEKYLSKFMLEHLSVNGYYIKFIKGTATQSKFQDIVSVVDMWEEEGYEIHMLIVDYLSKLSVEDMEGMNPSFKYQKLFEHFKDLCSSRKIAGITPHQASSEMTDILKDPSIRSVDVVKAMSGKDYIQFSKAINQVVDMTIIGARARYEGKWVLTLFRDRRRFPEIIDDKDLYTALVFPNKMPIPSDITKEKEVTIDVDSDYGEE